MEGLHIVPIKSKKQKSEVLHLNHPPPLPKFLPKSKGGVIDKGVKFITSILLNKSDK
jgi:hypothetical protein